MSNEFQALRDLGPDPRVPRTQPSCFNIATMGHVDHGKSTLVAFLLWNRGYFTDRDVEDVSGVLAHLMDRHPQERERGLSIQETMASLKVSDEMDAMVVDNPGHHSFLKNLVTGLSVSQAGIVVIDCLEHEVALASPQARTPRSARKCPGITRTQLHIAKWLGIRHFIVAVSKMDRADYDKDLFDECSERAKSVLAEIGIAPDSVPVVPTAICEEDRSGENIVEKSTRMPWASKTFAEALESVHPWIGGGNSPFRASVLEHCRGVQGKSHILRVYVEQGSVETGAAIVIQPYSISTTLKSIWPQDRSRLKASRGPDAAIERASAPMLVSLELGLHLKGSKKKRKRLHFKKGSVLTAGEGATVANRVSANVMLMPDEGDLGRRVLGVGQEFTMEMAGNRVPAVLDAIVPTGFGMSDDTFDWELALASEKELAAGSLASVLLRLRRPVVVDTVESAGRLARFVMRSGRWVLGGGALIRAEGADLGASFESLRVFQRHPGVTDWMSFERLILDLFSGCPWLACEYQATMAGMRSDIVLRNLRSDYGIWKELGEFTIVECKHWKAEYGGDVVFKLAGQMSYSNASSGIIASIRGPKRDGSPGAAALAAEFCRRGVSILLMNEEDILQLIEGASLEEVLTEMRRRLACL